MCLLGKKALAHVVLADDMSQDLQGRDTGERMVQSSSAGRLKYTKQRFWSVSKGMRKLIPMHRYSGKRSLLTWGVNLNLLLYPNQQLIRQIPPILITIISHPQKGDIP